MPLDLEKQIEMVPVTTGDMSDIPPDMPDGHWRGAVEVTNGAGKPEKGSYPMLTIKWSGDEALSEGNEDKIGLSARSWIVIYPQGHANEKRFKQTVKEMADLYPDLPPFDTSSLSQDPPSFESLGPWVEAFESETREFWTFNQKTNTGEMMTNIRFRQPGKKVEVASVEETEEEDKPAAEEKPKKLAAGATANGHKKVKGKK